MSSSGEKMFHMSSSVDRSDTSATNDNTAKPDIVGLIMPKLMEFKTDQSTGENPTEVCYEVLLQAVNRLLVLSDINVYYNRFTCDAITSYFAFIVSHFNCER
jgi:hypothetical protein